MKPAHRFHRCIGIVGALLLIGLGNVPHADVMAATHDFGLPAFQTLWNQTDAQSDLAPVWGPAFTDAVQEPYTEAPGGTRVVQYFDKGRMEMTDPASGVVTSGLLAIELISGKVQTGNATSRISSAAEIPVAGDPDNTWPTYNSLGTLRTMPAAPNEPVTRVYNKNGTFGTRDAAQSDPRAAYAGTDTVTGHTVPKAFADFRNDPRHPLSTIGLAITEAFWTTVKVGGQPTDVMVQAFERRVLTYTPSNDAAYQVEFGNIGQHYYRWRYRPAITTPVPPGVAPQFVNAYGVNFNPGLGNPLQPTAANVSYAVLRLETGYMIYVASTKKIYVLASPRSSVIGVFDDTYQEGVDDPGGKAGPKMWQSEPMRGFGKVWRANPSVQAQLGYATDPEYGLTDAPTQSFQNGFAFVDATKKRIWMINETERKWAIYDN